MKSVHITNYYHKSSGGISTAYNQLLEAANRRKRFVRLIVPGETTSVEEIGEFGKIYYVKAKFSPVFDKRYRIMVPWKTYIFEGSPIKTILREEKPDLIEIGEKYLIGLMAGLVRKNILTLSKPRPILVHFSCERMDDNVASFIVRGKLSRWLCRQFMGLFNLPMFDFHLANSEYTAGELYDAVSQQKRAKRSEPFVNLSWRYMRAPKIALKHRIFVNQCGVDNETFSYNKKNDEARRQLNSRLGISDDVKILLYAGRISPEKNIKLLVGLMGKLREMGADRYQMVVAGEGPALEGLRRLAETRVPGKVTFLGHVNNKCELATIYANSDAFVHTNPNEPFGIAPLEALASGLPLIAPNSGGVLSYADSQNSWLAEPTSAAFAAAVEEVFRDDDRRLQRVAKGLETSSKYSWTSSTDALFEIYDRMYELFRSDHELYDYQKFPRETDFAPDLTAC